MAEIYSSGACSEVYKLTDSEKRLFPEADLVKIVDDKDRFWFARLFYRHKIAHLLFPDNFIDVVGATVNPQGPDLSEEIKIFDKSYFSAVDREHRLYSKLAKVDPEHATYSNHMRLVANNSGVFKKSICPCSVCESHREVHEKMHMEEKAMHFGRNLSSIGLGLPWDDPSDYCLSGENIIFFEIDHFEEKVLLKHLTDIINPTSEQIASIKLLNRYGELKRMSRDIMISGKCCSFRCN
jgi:hypothetical protein